MRGEEAIAEVGAWCAACRFRVGLPCAVDDLLALMLSPLRPFEPVVVAREILSPEGRPHSIRVIPTGANVREPGAYVEFAADHEPFWTYRTWLSLARLAGR
jgi:hypothetical protein